MKIIASLALAATLALSSMSAAVAGPFDDANAFLRQETGVPDFTLNPAEFGNNNFVRVVHLNVEFLVGIVNGYVLIYNAADPGVPVFKGHAGGGYSEPTQTREMWETCGPGAWFITTVGTGENNKWCTPAHLVGKSGGDYLDPSTYRAPVARNCDIKVNGANHDHSC